MALKQTYYQVISTNDYEGCLWGVYIDPGTIANAVAAGGKPVTTDAVQVGGQIVTTPSLDNPPASVLYIPANTADPDYGAYPVGALYREGVPGKLTIADQAKQANVSFNIPAGQAVGVTITYENRNGIQILHVDIQAGFRRFDLGPVK